MAKKRYAVHLDLQKNELQNATLQNLNASPDGAVEGQMWYDTVSKRPKYNNGTETKDFGKEYTAGTGITLSGEELSVTDYDLLLKNQATLTGTSLAIEGSAGGLQNVCIKGTIIGSTDSSVAIGDGARINITGATYGGNVAIGKGADTRNGGNCIAIGYGASSTATDAIQIGGGTNKKERSLSIGFPKLFHADESYNYELLDGTTGLIPDERISSNIARTTDIPSSASDINALPNTTKYGYSIDVALNDTDYKLTVSLKDQDGTVLNSKVVDFPVESMVVSGSFDKTNKKIVLTLQNGNTTDVPVGDLIAGLQTEITITNKLASDLVDDTNQTHKFVTSAEKTTWNNKQNALSSTNKLNPAYIDYNTTYSAVSASEKSTWNNKQDALGYTPCKKITADNPVLTVSGGQVTWTITNSIGSKYVAVHVYEASTGEEVGVSSAVSDTNVVIKMNSTTNIEANTYFAVIIG